MKNNQLLKEVRQLQKIAGILKEDEGSRTSGGFRILDLDGEGITELVDIVDLADFERKVAQLEQASRKFQTAYTEMSEEVPHFADPVTSDMADVFFGGDDPLTVEPNDSISFKDWAKSVVRAYNSSSPGMQAERFQQLAVADTEGGGGGGPLQCEPGQTKWTDGPNSFFCYPTNGPNQPQRTATQHPV